MSKAPEPRLEVIYNRLPIVTGGLVIIAIVLLLAIARLQQLSPAVRQEAELRSQNNTQSIRRLPAERGIIYDRDGVPLAFNVLEYEIGVSPNLVTDPERLAQEMGVILNVDEFEVFNRITRPLNWVQIARPVSAELGQQIADLENIAVTIDPLSDRAYPQAELAGPIIGFTIASNDNNTRGAIGVEAFYNDELAGRPLDQIVSTIPLDLDIEVDTGDQRGMDLVLTIDRDLQYWMEYELALGVERYNADGGVIIVLDPRTGDVLAMAQNPTFNPNTFAEVEDPDTLRNVAVADLYEPGSVMKVLTVATALDAGVITRDWTYNDTGRIEVGGVGIVNWDRNSYGLVDTQGLLTNSLNIGAATVALESTPEIFYSGLRRFGLDAPTRIDLPGEASGIMRVPGDQGWSEGDFASNSYGQAISTTPIQMANAFAAIANDGLMYQPRVVSQIIQGDEIRESQPTVTRVIRSETANLMTEMMVRVVEEGATLARVPGYSVAGKTGTGQIATPLGYEDGIRGQTIASFIGFFPADAPQVVVYVRLDRPRTSEFGSQTAAPLFSQVAQRLAMQLGIPPDAVRQTLLAAGGSPNAQQP